MSGTPTNPYYQKVFTAQGGQLARSSSVNREFKLIQDGFDRIGEQSGLVKYQLSCSDLVSDLVGGPARAYMRSTDHFRLLEVRGSLLQASDRGAVRVNLIINGYNGLYQPLQIDEGSKTSIGSLSPAQVAYVDVPDDSEVVIDILSPGRSAKGLIVTLLGLRVSSSVEA